jgi:hypothetical protein
MNDGPYDWSGGGVFFSLVGYFMVVWSKRVIPTLVSRGGNLTGFFDSDDGLRLRIRNWRALESCHSKLRGDPNAYPLFFSLSQFEWCWDYGVVTKFHRHEIAPHSRTVPLMQNVIFAWYWRVRSQDPEFRSE